MISPFSNTQSRSIYLPSLKTQTKHPNEKMALSPKSLAGSGYVILNILKGMNITGLLAIIAASVLMLIKTTADSNVSNTYNIS
jgi:hypothetical protein